MAHPHEKSLLHLFGWRQGEKGNNGWPHSSPFYCDGKHTNQLLLNTNTHDIEKILQTTHKIWGSYCELYHIMPHLLNCIEITRRGKSRLTALPLVAHMCASLKIELRDRLITFPFLSPHNV